MKALPAHLAPQVPLVNEELRDQLARLVSPADQDHRVLLDLLVKRGLRERKVHRVLLVVMASRALWVSQDQRDP